MLRAAGLLSDCQRALRKWNGFLVPSRCIVLHDLPGQAQRFSDVALLRACRVRLLTDRERALQERLRLRIDAGGLVQQGEIVKRGGGVWMLGAERLLTDGERALEERLGLRVGADGLVQQGKIVDRGSGVGVLRAARLLIDRQRALVELLGLRVAA